MAVFYDTHSHLDYPDYTADFDQVIQRSEQAEIKRMITIGTDLESSRRAISLSDRHEGIYAAIGWHPNNADTAPEDLRPELRALASHPKVVAIGETGLDYYRLPSKTPGGSPDADEAMVRQQERIFRQQLEVAREFGLNCVIHQRQAFEDTLRIMKEYTGTPRGVFHCFVGTVSEMEEVLAIDSLVSFTGIVTFKNGAAVRDTLKATPAGKFMLETDCPYLAPVPYRGKRCEPAYVKEISNLVASERGESLEELSRATCSTAHQFFYRLSPAV